MSNPLFNVLGRQTQPSGGDDISQMIGQIEQFRNSFRGDPRAEVERLISTGQMTQAQFNQLGQAANRLRRFIK